ncbi:Tn3 family transposase [Streptomyces sp. Pv4-95]|uniref:Tn3 family transposase n=1 Tax=Streptomyces sp. Pv4-95 TaxID=3049543 RepID=UPI0038911A5E
MHTDDAQVDVGLHLLQSALVHVNTLLSQQVLAERAGAKKLSDEDRRGPTALFWSGINPHGTYRLDMTKGLDLLLPTVPGSLRLTKTARCEGASGRGRGRGGWRRSAEGRQAA